VREEARRWWTLAEDDLTAARHATGAGDHYVAAFYSQQAAEKALKGLWLERKRELSPKTHDLTELASGLSVPANFETSLLLLNPAYVNTRYPDAANSVPSRIYNGEIAGNLIQCAKEIMDWCRSELGLS
jgi:HEPN domain-containing protein